MLRVKNKKTVIEIAGITYRANKNRNLLAVFAISLTTFLIATVLATGASYWNTISQRQIRMEGMDYDIELSEPRDDQVKTIRSKEKVEYAGVMVKCGILEQYKETALDKIRLYWLDETCWEKQTVPALESFKGEYPQSEDEIMLGKNALNAMGIPNPKIGMKLNLTYFTLEEGSDEELLAKEFVLSGWYTDYSRAAKGYVSKAFFNQTGVKQTDLTQGLLRISLKNPVYSESDIKSIREGLDMRGNQYLSADYNLFANFFIMLLGLAALLIMIFASGYLFIYNTMYISISKDIRYYGQLKTLGMTSVQLKSIIYRQAVWNSAAGIPLGLAAAAVTAEMMIPQLLHIANPTFSAKDIVSVNVWVFLLGGCFAFLTNLISCRKPAKMAGDCSPVEAMRYIPYSGKRKNRRREWGGIYSMAFQNMFRDRKQAAVIFASFVIVMSVFMSVNTIIRANDAERILNEIYSYDIRFKNETVIEDDRKQLITEEKISQTEKAEGVKSVRKVGSEEVVIPYQEEIYGDYFKELYQSRYSPGNYEEDMALYRKEPGSGLFMPRFISIDEKGFDLLNEDLGNVLDRDDFEQGKTAVALKYFTEGDNGMTGKTVRFYFPDETGEGQTVQEHTVQIAAVAGSGMNPAYFAGGLTPDLIVSEKYAEKLGRETITELIDIEYENAYSKETERKVKAVFAGDKQISHESKLERYAEMKNTETQVKVLGNSAGVIIALLAVLNYLNTMAASVQNRSGELASLESIGMTAGQIKKMLRAEGIGYALISLLLSSVIGFPASYVVFQAAALYKGVSFSVPWIRNLMLFGIVLAVCAAAPVVIYRRTQGASVVERLRCD